MSEKTLELIADLLALYSTPLPCGDWGGAFDKSELIKNRLAALGWDGGNGPQPSAEVMKFLRSRKGI